MTIVKMNAVGQLVVPGLGQPKSAAGETFSGVPGSAASRAWTFFSPSGDTNPPGPPDSLYMCPVFIPEPLTVREIEVVTEGSITVPAAVRVAISAAGRDWQPTGNVLYQGSLTIPGTAKTFDGFHLSPTVPLKEGLYLFALETNEPTLLLNGRPATFPGSTFCADNPGGPNHLLDALIAPHTFGAFTTMPKWTRVSTFQQSLYGGWVSPFVVKWTTP